MPCDSIRTISVDLSAMGRIDANLFAAAMRDIGLASAVRNGQDGKPEIVYFGSGEWINVRTGQSQLAAGRDVNAIKRAYSRQVVVSQCKRFGWAFKESTNEAGQVQFTVTKR